MPAKRRAGGIASTRNSTSRVASTKPSRDNFKQTPKSPTSDAFEDEDASPSDSDSAHAPQAKRQRTAPASREQALKRHELLFGHGATGVKEEATCSLPVREHRTTYHRPLLLDSEKGRKGQDALLSWFDSVSSARSMPWRKAWIDPSQASDPAALRKDLERRAYEVWISEIMLQQTRVAVVIDYWNRWMGKWPTMQELAAADPEEVLAAWQGLGYYSRATRIHQAAKLVVARPDMDGLLPEDVKKLEADVPGVGRYTAGAITSIVFGNPEPMVDGNVLRVLSRQLGILGNVKSDKKVIDTLWAAADAIVKDVAWGDDQPAADAQDKPKSNRPGRWGQGLMELGSTVCTPKPNCAECPITTTCRAYQEGKLAAAPSKTPDAVSTLVDIEETCSLCESFENTLDTEEEKNAVTAKTETKKPVSKQSTLASFAFTIQTKTKQAPKADSKELEKSQLETIVNHAKRFPLKVVKKAVREEETLVCAIRRSDGAYLIHRRPQKGLLAGLWELPSHILDASEAVNPKKRKSTALSYVTDLLNIQGSSSLRHVGEVGSVPWLFSHIKLTMHVHLFELDTAADGGMDSKYQPSKWSKDIDAESMGTGMRKCCALVDET